MQYPIYALTLGPHDQRLAQQLEQMGTKEKLWLRNVSSGQLVMLKFARPDTGEDWSEKVAFELARRLGVPCPRVDLAIASKKNAVLCWDFLRNRFPDARLGRHQRSLIHGNELLLQRDPQYPSGTSYHVSEHTVTAVHDGLRGHGHQLRSPLDTTQNDAFSAFVGYLMLDALIGNTDRHHENWAVVVERSVAGSNSWLAPSYDHASSLGRELNDQKRLARMSNTGRGAVKDYAEKAKSAFSAYPGGRRLTTYEALVAAGQLRPDALVTWKGRLERLSLATIRQIVERVPDSRLSTVGKRFTHELLRYNRQRLLDLMQ